MKIKINLDSNGTYKVPSLYDIHSWVNMVPVKKDSIGVLLKLVNRKTMCDINKKYKNLYKETNVLSFPLCNSESTTFYIGVILLCPIVISEECYKTHLDYYEHWSHLIIHGVLHLLNFTHNNKNSDCVMSLLEAKLLFKLKIT